MKNSLENIYLRYKIGKFSNDPIQLPGPETNLLRRGLTIESISRITLALLIPESSLSTEPIPVKLQIQLSTTTHKSLLILRSVWQHRQQFLDLN